MTLSKYKKLRKVIQDGQGGPIEDIFNKQFNIPKPPVAPSTTSQPLPFLGLPPKPVAKPSVIANQSITPIAPAPVFKAPTPTPLTVTADVSGKIVNQPVKPLVPPQPQKAAGLSFSETNDRLKLNNLNRLSTQRLLTDSELIELNTLKNNQYFKAPEFGAILPSPVKPTISQTLQEQEDARQSVTRSQRMEKRMEEPAPEKPSFGEMALDAGSQAFSKIVSQHPSIKILEAVFPNILKSPEGVAKDKIIETSLAKSFEQTTAGIVSSVGGSIEMIGDKLNSADIKSAGEEMADRWRKVIKEHPEWNEPAEWSDPQINKWKDPRLYARFAGSVIPSIGASLFAGTVGGLLAGPVGAGIGAGTTMFSLESGGAYNDMIDRGIAPDKAATAAGIYGAIAAALESINFIRIGNKIFTTSALGTAKEGFLKMLIKELPKTVSIEMTTEGAQQLAQNLVTKFLDSSKSLMQGVLESTVAGGIGGLLFGGVGTSVDVVKQKQEQKRETQALNDRLNKRLQDINYQINRRVLTPEETIEKVALQNKVAEQAKATEKPVTPVIEEVKTVEPRQLPQKALDYLKSKQNSDGTITVYRGIKPGGEMGTGQFWTTDKSVAEMYAHGIGPGGKVVTKDITFDEASKGFIGTEGNQGKAFGSDIFSLEVKPIEPAFVEKQPPSFISEDLQGNKIEQIFIREPKKSELSNPGANKNLIAIPDKEGWEKVYKPYGEQGRGFYYIKQTKPETPSFAAPTAERPSVLDKKMVPGTQAKQNAKEIIQRLKLRNVVQNDADIILTDKTGGEAFAAALGNEQWYTKEVPEFTGEHETVHTIYDNVDKMQIMKEAGVNRAALDKELRSRYPGYNDVQIKEVLSENYELYKQRRAKEKPKSILDRFFEAIVNFFKKIFNKNNATTVNKFYKIVEKGKAKTPATVSEAIKGRPKSFKRAGKEVVEFGKTVEEGFIKKPLKAVGTNIDEVNKFLTDKYGKTIDSASKSQLQEAFREAKAVIAGEEIINKIASPANGFSKNQLKMKPDLLAGYHEGVLTDGYLLIKDKQIAQDFIHDYFEKNQRSAQKKSDITEAQVQELIKKDIEQAKEGKFPDIKAVMSILKDTRSAQVQGIYTSNGIVFAVISNGEAQEVVDVDKLAFMQKQLPNAEIRMGNQAQMPISFVEKGEIRGLLMPIVARRDNIPFPVSFKARTTKQPIAKVIEKRPKPIITEKAITKPTTLLQEARKYKTAEEFVKAQESKYKGVHEAPTRGDGDAVAPAYALDKIYPADIYSSNATRYYSSGMPYDAETISTLQSIKGKPNATITVYRAVPGTKTNTEMIARYEAQKRAILKNGKIPDAEMAKKYNLNDSSTYYDFIDNEIQRLKGATEPKVEKYAINEGDWVTPNRKYAVDHGMSNLGGNYKILSKEVRVDELFTDANSIQEFGYSPRESSQLSKSRLTDIWNEANKPTSQKVTEAIKRVPKPSEISEKKITVNEIKIGDVISITDKRETYGGRVSDVMESLDENNKITDYIVSFRYDDGTERSFKLPKESEDMLIYKRTEKRAPTLVSLGIKPPQEKVNVLKKDILKMRMKEQAKGAKLGFTAGTAKAREAAQEAITLRLTETEVVKERLNDYIESSLPIKKEDILEANPNLSNDEVRRYSVANVTVRDGFRRMVSAIEATDNDAKTKNELIRAYNRIDERAKKVARKNAIETLRNRIKSISESDIIDVDYKEMVKDLISDIETVGHRKSTIERLFKTSAYITKQLFEGKNVAIPQYVLQSLEILKRKPISQLSLEEINVINDRLSMLEDFGKLKLRTENGIFDFRIESLLQQITEDKGLNYKVLINVVERESAGAGERLVFGDKLKNFLFSVYNTYTNAELKTDNADFIVFSVDGFKENGFTQLYIKDPIDISYGNSTMEISRRKAYVNKRIKEDGLTDDQGMDVMGLYALSIQPGGKQKLINSKTVTEKALEGITLSKKEAEFVEFVKKEFKEIGERIREILKRDYNITLADIPDYIRMFSASERERLDEMPIKDRMEAWAKGIAENVETISTEDISSSGRLITAKNLKQTFTKHRTKSENKLKTNLLDMLFNHYEDALYFIHMSGVIKETSAIVNSPRYQQYAGTQGGKFMSEFMDLVIKRGGSENAERTRILDILIRNIGVSTLSNLSTALIQPSTIFDAYGLIGQDAFIGAAEFISNRNIRTFIYNMFPEAVGRVDIDDYVYKQLSEYKNFSAFQDAGLWGIRKLDYIAAASSLWGAFRHYTFQIKSKSQAKSLIKEIKQGATNIAAQNNEETIKEGFTSLAHMLPQGMTIEEFTQGMLYAQRIMRESNASTIFYNRPAVFTKGHKLSLTGSKTFDRMLTPFLMFTANLKTTAKKQLYYKGIKAKNPVVVSRYLLGAVLGILFGYGVKETLRYLIDKLTGKEHKYDKMGLIKALFAGMADRFTFGIFGNKVTNMVQFDKGADLLTGVMSDGYRAGQQLITGEDEYGSETETARIVGALKGLSAIAKPSGIPFMPQVIQIINKAIENRPKSGKLPSGSSGSSGKYGKPGGSSSAEKYGGARSGSSNGKYGN